MESTARPLSLRDVLSVFWRHRIAMVVITVVCIVIGVVSIQTTRPVYQSTTQILVANPVGQNNAYSNIAMPSAETDIATQIQVLQSAKLMIECFEAAGVDFSSYAANIPTVTVVQAGTTRVFNVSVNSVSPTLSQSLALVIPEVFRRYQLQSDQEQLDSALTFLVQRRQEETEALREAQQKLAAFRAERNLLPLDAETAQRTGGFTGSRAAVEQARVGLELLRERRRAVENKLRTTPKMIENPGAASNQQAIDAQRNRIKELEAQREALLMRFFEDSQEIQQLDIQIQAQRDILASLPRLLDGTAEMVNPEYRNLESQLTSIDIDIRVAEQGLARAMAMAGEATGDFREFQDIQTEQQELEKAVAIREETIAGLLKSIEDLRLRRNTVRDPVTVLSPARPATQVEPRPRQTMIMALLVGIFLSVAYALFRDALDDRLTVADDLHAITGLPSVGAVPALPRSQAILAVPELPNNVLESYRLLRFNLLFSTIDSPVKSIVVTSTDSGEGKTDLACNLAVAASGEGRRVLLVDGNLRSPSIHKKMNVQGKPGLTDVIIGTSTLEESLHQTVIPGLQVLTCGSMVSTPTDLLASPSMQVLFKKMTEMSDLVIFDSPACSKYADAQVLSNIAEGVLYVGRVGKTRRTAMRRGIYALQQARARVLGVALSGANPK